MIRTDRLLLRRWRDDDLDAFAALNADPVVMEHFPERLTREQSARFLDKIRTHFDQHGFGLWAVEVPDDAPFVGMVGLKTVNFDAAFAPAVEIGWRMAAAWWGQGLATEAAQGALRYGFTEAKLDEIVSFTALLNRPSWRVMERLGMRRNPREDFDHPAVPEGHRLRRHMLYRLHRTEWRARQG
ncbi:MAG: GNAT family N-acetyltransferase [Myxococcota bacterium]